ncbi:DUF6223 family protein [Streptomyces sp. NPDC056528]|uniref:DUF6223 family protein n=1 Tax=Streptomyces sp. NPDC056528 TaxID=3345854 RepID=UPI0036B6C496
MGVSAVLMAAAEGGIIGDGRTGANLALAAGGSGLVIGRLARVRAGNGTGNGSGSGSGSGSGTGNGTGTGTGTGGARTWGRVAVALGIVGAVLGVLHLVTASGGPGTGNGLVGAVVAVPLGLGSVLLGRRATSRHRRAGRSHDRPAV